jgi:hypothetical protein
MPRLLPKLRSPESIRTFTPILFAASLFRGQYEIALSSPSFDASVDVTNGTSLRRVFLYKWLQVKELPQSVLDWRKLLQQLALGQIGFLKLVSFVDVTDARCAKGKGIVRVRPPACRARTICHYWKRKVQAGLWTPSEPVAEASLSRPPTTAAASFLPVSIVDPDAGTHLEIELANACVVRLWGSLSPRLLRAAIKAAGRKPWNGAEAPEIAAVLAGVCTARDGGTGAPRAGIMWGFADRIWERLSIS